MKIVDLRGILPYEERFDAGAFAGKTTTTGHWPGIEIDPAMDDVAALELVERLAQGHIDRDWSAIFGHQGGASLMYHEVLAPSGTLFITRDPDAIVWHAESSEMLMAGSPNTTSHSLLVLYSSRLTLAQRRSLAAILPSRPRPTYGNSEWMGTACPGPELLALVHLYRATGKVITEGSDMDKETFRQWFLELYGELEVAKTFDEMKAIEAELAGHVRKLAANETIDDADLAALRARIDAIAVAAAPA